MLYVNIPFHSFFFSLKSSTFADIIKLYCMKRILLSIFSLFILFSTAAAQPRITSNKETHQFGQIEWKRPVMVEYVITNTGNKPLVLTNVTTSCACSVAEWTKEPIPPKGKGVVKASFDAKALGHFEKTVGIYSNAEPHLVYLKFTGEVVQEVKDYTQQHPYAIGKIRIEKEELAFPDSYRGENPVITLSVVNLSDRPYEPVLMHLPPYLKVEKEPAVLLKGKKGTVKVTLDTQRLKDYGLTQTSVYLSRFAGDKVSEENEIPVSAILLPPFAHLSKKDSLNAPAIRLSETDIDLSVPLMRKEKAGRDILISNAGKKPLVISKLQVFNSSVEVALKKRVIPPGGSTKLRVTIHKRSTGNKKHHLRILMITNDPLRPKVELNIKR
ncbi:hypothetical protein IX307_001069 [Bacteroides pyogenes]|nr:hypothetical protein [Bacteroides pyogenes]MBR8724916.1 hypothetical protein [Bacteroides pyogenes]MBR8738415.1 hypothetical protein [Bacteroides pyogenes]MBR8754128.1 hypothetical protein [Bacteroides pyogenes]MBR8786755.1 hypothetical protein [Bacteroides pyogenes]